MKNLIKAITEQHNQRFNDFLTSIKIVKSIETELNHWQYNNLLPRGKKLTNVSLQEAKEYLIKRKKAAIEKEINEDAKKIKSVFNAEKLVSIKISVEWKKSRMWGMNPKAEAWATFKTKNGTQSKYVTYGNVSGCGYDKLSTAVAGCLNQINETLKPLYLAKNKSPNNNNRELLGYGSGYGILPYFEGGVGVDCYKTIFDKIGYKFDTIASGKQFDVFMIEKK